MTKRPMYECNGCGERHGHRTEMVEVRLRHASGEWEEPTDETIHLCIECNHLSLTDVASTYEFVLVEAHDGPVVGVKDYSGNVLTKRRVIDGGHTRILEGMAKVEQVISAE